MQFFNYIDETLICHAFIVTTATLVAFIGSKRAIEIFKKQNSSIIDGNVLDLSQALEFPLIASRSLFLIYVFLKYIPSYYINNLIGFYLCCAGIVSTNYAVRPILGGSFTLGLASIAIGIAYAYSRYWIFNNIMAVCIAIMSIGFIRFSSFLAVLSLLTLLFFYDIFWVFGTDVMLTVATGVDGPIKILFPRNVLTHFNGPMSLLGLGDIVIPSFYMSFVGYFSYEISKKKNGLYFYVCLIAYFLSLVNTIVIMVIFQHGQPALLYIVPYLIFATFFTALFYGEVNSLLYSDTEKKNEKGEEKKSGEKDANVPLEKKIEDQLTDIIMTNMILDFFGYETKKNKKSEETNFTKQIAEITNDKNTNKHNSFSDESDSNINEPKKRKIIKKDPINEPKKRKIIKKDPIKKD